MESTTQSLRNPLRKLGRTVAVVATLAIPFSSGLLAQAQGLDPSSVVATIEPGESLIITKTVHTPVIPPLPDIVFLADTTGSMGGAIANVQTNIGSIMSGVLGSAPSAAFGAAQYKDPDTCDAVGFNLDQALTTTTANVQTAVNTWSASGGCDTPEGQLNALFQLATSGAVGFRTDSTRIIVWFGDASGHDPSNGITLTDAINALTGGANSPIRVIAINVNTGAADGLDATGQATAITSATGGVLLPTATPDQVSAAIVAGLENLPATVSMTSDCAAPISTSFAPASQTVPSGSDAVFTETISVAADAAQGQTYTCRDWALINGTPMTDATGAIVYETKTITVPDVTAPEAACTETTNPNGQTTPPAGSTTLPGPNGGQNEDGFYALSSTDNVDPNAAIFVVDSGSGQVFGPFTSGTKIKYTQAPGATPSQKAIGSANGQAGAVAWHITGTGDAAVHAVDAAGNESEPVDCLVAPLPK